ncbi:heavy-metal-associated domain-containing protein [Tomitella cavernea]|uniref:Heavy-metal-associated domain-containing protein n=1 Tax=Tomitella cavernea TaxID=1387982 RepID=A0ABP9C7B8_9ACTN|nr:heavy-metal-associated domain-containing protein [Tomitella cavernea]
MSTTEYAVTGMSCGHCEGAVREEVEALPGVEVVSVSAQDGTLVVSSLQPVDDAAVISAVDEAGYQACRK